MEQLNELMYLEEFKVLTDSSSLPVGIKEQFKKVANQDINVIVASLDLK